MRVLLGLWLASVLALAGCGSSDSGSARSDGPDDGGNGGNGGMPAPGGEAPMITSIAWAPDGPCSLGTFGNYTVTITAMDPEGDPIAYDGSVLGCTGALESETSTIGCPNAAPYGGTAVVEDNRGNVSVPVDFVVGVCETGSFQP